MGKPIMESSKDRPAKGPSLSNIALGTASLFIILEPLWMLLPFAGFLYGSVMHIETLSENPYTTPLVHFVFPTHTLFPLGLILISVGILTFVAGAIQIYSGKIRKKGLIKTGLYRNIRHPQYLALSLFGIGVIITWGRLITFISFFVMLWLYYYLAKREERKCQEIFGQEYQKYLASTYFIFPGVERLLSATCPKSPLRISSGAKVLISFLLVVSLASSIGLLIIKIRAATRQSLPVIIGSYRLSDQKTDTFPLLMVKGPALQAAPSDKIRDRFMNKRFEMIMKSQKINESVKHLHLSDGYTLLAFVTPGSNWYNTHRDYRHAKINIFIFCIKTKVSFNGGNFREFRRNWQIDYLVKVEDISSLTPKSDIKPLEEKIVTETYRKKMEERVYFLLSGLKR